MFMPPSHSYGKDPPLYSHYVLILRVEEHSYSRQVTAYAANYWVAVCQNDEDGFLPGRAPYGHICLPSKTVTERRCGYMACWKTPLATGTTCATYYGVAGPPIRRRRARVSPLGMPLKVITVPHPEGNNKGGVQLRGALENSTGSWLSLRHILRSGGSASKLSLYGLVGLQSMWMPTWGGSWLCRRRESNN